MDHRTTFALDAQTIRRLKKLAAAEYLAKAGEQRADWGRGE